MAVLNRTQEHGVADIFQVTEGFHVAEFFSRTKFSVQLGVIIAITKVEINFHDMCMLFPRAEKVAFLSPSFRPSSHGPPSSLNLP